jgi:hypothetical protein
MVRSPGSDGSAAADKKWVRLEALPSAKKRPHPLLGDEALGSAHSFDSLLGSKTLRMEEEKTMKSYLWERIY